MHSPARLLLRRSISRPLALALGTSHRLAFSTSVSRKLPAARATEDARRRTNANEKDTRPWYQINVDHPDSKRLPSFEAHWTHHSLVLSANDGRAQKLLPASTIRDNCSCTICRDPSSGQKSFSTPSINTSLGIKSVRRVDDGLGVTFEDQRYPNNPDNGHETILTWDEIEVALKAKETYERDPPPSLTSNVLRNTGVVHWDKEILSEQVRKIDYHDYMQGGEAFWDAVIDICRFGIVFLKNVPRDEDSVVKITTQIANIRETFYGRTFDVVAKPDAENVAYTSGYLGLHQDLLYLLAPPKIQILHCMDNSCEGGESLFSDGDRVGRLLWLFNKESRAIQHLNKFIVPYAYKKHGYNYDYRRPVINTFGADEYKNVFWSPPFQGKHRSGWNIAPFIPPTRLFERLINDEDAVFKAKLQPGECVLFDNIRVMHGRTAFDVAGGQRWLRGAYIAEEDFRSKALSIPRELSEKYRGPVAWEESVATDQLKNSKWIAPLLAEMRKHSLIKRSALDKGDGQ